MKKLYHVKYFAVLIHYKTSVILENFLRVSKTCTNLILVADLLVVFIEWTNKFDILSIENSK